MPPKRKASQTVHSAAQTPTRRSGRLRGDSASAATPPPAKRQRRMRSTADVEIDEEPAPEHDREPAPRVTRSRQPIGKPSPASAASAVAGSSKPRSKQPEPITTTRRGNHARVSENEEVEDEDELLLTPSKRPPASPVTPPRTTTGTPRVGSAFMACVEISSPGRRAFNESSSVHSSRPQSGLRHLLQAPVRAPSPSPVKRPSGQSTPSTQGPELPQRSSSSRRKALPQPIFPSLPRSPPSSPTKRFLSLATLTPSPLKPRGEANVQVSPSRKGRGIPPRLYFYLEVQKRAILKALRNPPEIEEEAGTELEDDGPSTNSIAYEQLSDLLKGTVVRGEGNSCLLIGPRGSGKTRIVEKAIIALPDNPIVIRLSGHAQQNDRVAIREIARQLTQQTGSSFLQPEEDKLTDDAFNDPENPFIDRPEVATDTTLSIALPPPAHLLALISMIPTLPRATIVVIDAFDQFATHARQSLLYCLLDTAQSCRAAKGNKGLAIIGVTTHVDTINLLEKRVKSRFSGRMLRTACPRRVEDWLRVSRSMLTAPIETEADDEWNGLWATTVDRFLKRDAVVDVLRDTFELTRDVRTLCHILTPVVVELSPEAPTLSASTLDSAAGIQRCPSRFPFLPALSYPALSLLVAAMHAQTSGHDAFTFEMLHESFRDQVRTSLSAPVQVDGGSVGMLQCSRNVLFGAFERLVSLRAFVAATPSTSTSREFVLYRCAIDRFDVKTAVDQSHQTLKKWLNKAQ